MKSFLMLLTIIVSVSTASSAFAGTCQPTGSDATSSDDLKKDDLKPIDPKDQRD